jgi:hypothetical protein
VNLASLESFLAGMGVSRNPATLAAAIRFVQRAEGNFDCFGTADGYCDQWECTWRSECFGGPRETPDPPAPPGDDARSIDEVWESLSARVRRVQVMRV